MEPIDAIAQVVNTIIARNKVLKSVIEDLLEQHERQLDMEDGGRRFSYPSKFPEWDYAWDNAAKALFEEKISDKEG